MDITFSGFSSPLFSLVEPQLFGCSSFTSLSLLPQILQLLTRFVRISSQDPINEGGSYSFEVELQCTFVWMDMGYE
jgi:hypothetical protein